MAESTDLSTKDFSEDQLISLRESEKKDKVTSIKFDATKHDEKIHEKRSDKAGADRVYKIGTQFYSIWEI